MASHTSKVGAGRVEEVSKLPYQAPVLTPIGNLHDVVANTTQNLACDGPEASGDGDHNPNPIC